MRTRAQALNSPEDHVEASDPSQGFSLPAQPCADVRECKICLKIFVLSVFADHVIQEHVDHDGHWKPCSICKKSLLGRTRPSVERHYADHRLPKAWRCPEPGCDHGAKHCADLKRHISRIHGKSVTTEFCRETGCYQPDVPSASSDFTSDSALTVSHSNKELNNGPSNGPSTSKNLVTTDALPGSAPDLGKTVDNSRPSSQGVDSYLPAAKSAKAAKSVNSCLSASKVDVTGKAVPSSDTGNNLTSRPTASKLIVTTNAPSVPHSGIELKNVHLPRDCSGYKPLKCQYTFALSPLCTVSLQFV